MKTAIDAQLLSAIAGLMDEIFTVEGAIYYLLSAHPTFEDHHGEPVSVAWMLSEGRQDEVLKELEEMARAAKEGETSGA